MILEPTNHQVKQARTETLVRLRANALGRDLHLLAAEFGVTVLTPSGFNKGWAGQTLERIAQLGNNNLSEPDGSDFELKSLKVIQKDGIWAPRETIKITNLNPQKILNEEFETSGLWKKLSHLVLVGCDYSQRDQAKVVLVGGVDVLRVDLVEKVRAIWEDVRHLVANGEIVQHFDIGKSTDYLQLRPTGTGKQLSTCPVTGEKFPARAFYATKRLLIELFKEC